MSSFVGSGLMSRPLPPAKLVRSFTSFQMVHTHTPSFTYNFVTHHLSHTTWSHIIFHTQLSHLVTRHLSHTPLSHNNFVTHHLSHTTLSHIIFHTQLCHTTTLSHPSSFSVAGVVLRALGWLWRRAWTGLVAPDAAALCVAGVGFAWHTWHLATSTFFLPGQRGSS